MVNLTPPPRTSTGIGKVVSFATFVALFTVLPNALKLVWPTIIETFPQPYLYLLVLIGTSVAILLPYNIVMWFIYTAKIPFFEKYRCEDKPWPWQSDPAQWRLFLRKTLGTVLFNLFILNLILPLFEYSQGDIKYSSSLEEWPTPQTMLPQFILFMLTEDFLFYWSHKTLHQPQFYWIHKKHHEYNITVTLASTYSHPLQYLFGNVMPTGIAYHLLAKVTTVHYVTIIAWLTFRLMETCEGHSGYDWSWGQLSFIPWKLGPDYHNFHHSKNVGNYGSMFGFWDNIMVTNQAYRDSKNPKIKS